MESFHIHRNNSGLLHVKRLVQVDAKRYTFHKPEIRFFFGKFPFQVPVFFPFRHFPYFILQGAQPFGTRFQHEDVLRKQIHNLDVHFQKPDGTQRRFDGKLSAHRPAHIRYIPNHRHSLAKYIIPFSIL